MAPEVPELLIRHFGFTDGNDGKRLAQTDLVCYPTSLVGKTVIRVQLHKVKARFFWSVHQLSRSLRNQLCLDDFVEPFVWTLCVCAMYPGALRVTSCG